MTNYIGTDGNDTLIGLDDVSDDLTGKKGSDVLIGGGGFEIDFAHYEGAASGVTVNLATGTSSGGDGNDTLNEIEGVVGSHFNDTLVGDDKDNWLTGNNGDDSLLGGNGYDTLKGGLGNDILTGGDLGFDTADYSDSASAVTVNLANGTATGGSGNDVLSGIESVIGSNFNDTLIGPNNTFESISLYGGNGNDTLLAGNSFFNTLDGGNGKDTLVGGNDSNDTLTGGLGNDVIKGGESSFIGDADLVEYGNASSAVTVNLATGTASGGEGNDILSEIEAVRGSSYNDVLIGNAENNFLEGSDGDDTLAGNEGDDTFTGGLGNDILTGGGSGKGFDWANYSDAISGVTVDLAKGLASGGAGNDQLSGIEGVNGSSDNDTLIGDANGNTLQGSKGDDWIMGNAGDDALFGEFGFDWVSYTDATSAVTVDLATGTASGGDGNDFLSEFEAVAGSKFNDTITGDWNNNTLEGRSGNDTLDGGAGLDTMIGGVGNDSYTVDDPADIITENLNAGTDKVNSSVSYTLLGNVENLTLTGAIAIDGTGNGLANALIGNSAANLLKGGAGNDTLDGKGGNDTLTGGSGNDIFRFTTKGHSDKITDYNVANDTIQLENSVFTALTATGPLAAGQFKVGTQAADANDFIVYNNATGALLYDADGNGANAAIQIATVGVGLAMTNADIVVI